jgi:TPR repeat protein
LKILILIVVYIANIYAYTDHYERICSKPNPAQCLDIANNLKNRGQIHQAISLYSKACDYRSSIACEELGDMYKNNLHNQYKARQSYEKSLRLNNQNPSLNYKLANMYEKGLGGVQNIKKAEYFYKKSCRSGYHKACIKLDSRNNRYTQKDKELAQAKSLTIKCVRQDHPYSCLKSARIYKKYKKYQETKELYQKACNRNQSQACKELADYHYFGFDGKKDRTLAKQYYKRACNLGHKDACNNLKDKFPRYNDHNNYRKKKEECNEYNQTYKGCKKECEYENNAKSCFILANLYSVGQKGARKSYYEMFLALEKACRLNHAKSCFYLGAINEKGKENIVSKNRREARKNYKKACNLGYNQACKKLDELRQQREKREKREFEDRIMDEILN